MLLFTGKTRNMDRNQKNIKSTCAGRSPAAGPGRHPPSAIVPRSLPPRSLRGELERAWKGKFCFFTKTQNMLQNQKKIKNTCLRRKPAAGPGRHTPSAILQRLFFSRSPCGALERAWKEGRKLCYFSPKIARRHKQRKLPPGTCAQNETKQQLPNNLDPSFEWRQEPPRS